MYTIPQMEEQIVLEEKSIKDEEKEREKTRRD